MATVHASFKPEFLNRFDEVVLFDPLNVEELSRIVELQVKELGERLKGRRLNLEVTEGARAWLAVTGFDPRTAPGRCAAWYSAKSATGWRGPSWPATSPTVTPCSWTPRRT